MVVAVLPCCKYNETSVFSHAGSSYGGPVVSSKHYTMDSLKHILNCILTFYRGNKMLYMRLPERLFYQGLASADPILYLLGRVSVIKNELSVALDLSQSSEQGMNKRRRNYLRKSESLFTIDATSIESDYAW